ncbi:WxcM-like domain-containing protein [Aliivibrio fischeri]|uniref:sugar 3,4-ketoisomerase n=1 Tax=Aliivibrio fischeri TaxID=668 RepID=UPI0012D8F72D|nr:FdtA/QdtA family cupin domain-containing protein [Aliivibrio fischeri]MUK77060.1 WxcM-like domain-containing protein [Aliivibrio fischeri]
MTLIKIIDFNVLGDERGSLISLEENKNIPFEIKRVYYIFATQKDIPRGFHAHKELKQLAVCIQGHCTILMDDGFTKESVVLDSPSQGLIIDVQQWHEMHDFSEDCILMVLASDYYNEDDYIRNYAEFMRETNVHS